jgi:hypothetical protein
VPDDDTHMSVVQPLPSLQSMSLQHARHVSPGPGSQSIVPVAHEHAPAVHDIPAPHALVHEPQCAVLDVTSVSHPLAVFPSQSPRPGMQVHTPAVQTCPVGHACPHAPQCCGSFCVSAHALVHSVVPLGHMLVHCPDAQIGAALEHAMVHDPQCAAISVLASQPLAALPSQLPQPC